MKTIKLTNSGETIVDDNDYDYLIKWKWQKSQHGYAVRCQYVSTEKVNTKRGFRSVNKLIFMHRVVNQTPKGKYTDHINGDKLDNRKSNLRTCTYSQNSINKPLKKDGIQYRKDRKKSPYRVYVSHDKKEIYIGSFSDYEDALSARFAADTQLNGEFARW